LKIEQTNRISILFLAQAAEFCPNLQRDVEEVVLIATANCTRCLVPKDCWVLAVVTYKWPLTPLAPVVSAVSHGHRALFRYMLARLFAR
jgi:hypothetical protein